MTFKGHLFLISIFLSVLAAQSFIDITANAIYSTADSCVQSCARSVSNAQDYFTLACDSKDPKCLCDVPSSNSYFMDLALELCVFSASCTDPNADVTAMGVFSAYCSANHVGADVADDPFSSGYNDGSSSTIATTTEPVVLSTTLAIATSRPTFTTAHYPTKTSSPITSTYRPNVSSNDNAKIPARSNNTAVIFGVSVPIVSIGLAVIAFFFVRRKRAQTLRQAVAAAAAATKNVGESDYFSTNMQNNSNQSQMTPFQQVHNQMYNYSSSNRGYDPSVGKANSPADVPSPPAPALYPRQQSWQWQQGGRQS